MLGILRFISINQYTPSEKKDIRTKDNMYDIDDSEYKGPPQGRNFSFNQFFRKNPSKVPLIISYPMPLKNVEHINLKPSEHQLNLNYQKLYLQKLQTELSDLDKELATQDNIIQYHTKKLDDINKKITALEEIILNNKNPCKSKEKGTYFSQINILLSLYIYKKDHDHTIKNLIKEIPHHALEKKLSKLKEKKFRKRKIIGDANNKKLENLYQALEIESKIHEIFKKNYEYYSEREKFFE